MTDTNWAIPGAQVYLSKPTAASEAAARPKTALQSAQEVRAQRDREVAALYARHAWLVANAPHPILAALVEAHGPHGDSNTQWPDCAACPANSDDYGDEPASWPCGVWSFISDRMEEDT
jgi:hypothetical protein